MQKSPPRESDIRLIVNQAVARSGLTQRALAVHAQVAPETLSRMCSRGSGDFATVAKVVQGAGLQLRAASRNEAVAQPAATGHRRLDARSLALHALAAGKLLANPSLVKSKVLPNIRRFKQIHADGGALPLLEAWERAATSGLNDLVRLCVDPSEKGQQMRQASPMTGLLLAAERRCVYEAFAA